MGRRPVQNQVFDYDATIVERLREAGAVLVAKLSMGALAQGDRWFRGQTKNPWNPSSDGLQRIVRRSRLGDRGGLVVFGIGTETRGSIISPSSRERRHRPSADLRPRQPLRRDGALSWTMDKIGPMCRSVEDCALVFNAIYGPDGRDDTVADAPFALEPGRAAVEAADRVHQEDFELQPPRRTRGRRQLRHAERAGGRAEAAQGAAARRRNIAGSARRG